MIPLIGAHDFPYLFANQAGSLWSLPLTWAAQSHDSLGVFTLSTLWTWPYGLLYGAAAKLGINFTVSTWILGILPVFIFGWIGMGKLLQGYSLSVSARRMGQLLFVANTYVLMLIDGGQLSLAVGYSLLPLAVSYEPLSWGFVLTIAATSFLDIRYLYLLVILVGIKTLFNLRQAFWYLTGGLVTGLVVMGLHSYWILPAILTKGPNLPATYTRAAQVDTLSFATLSHALLLFHPHWPKNIFGHISSPSPYFILLPLLTFLPLVLYKKNAIVAYWTVVALISAFLVKGSGEPFGQVYSWLFSKLPGFSLFRDPSKFFPLVILAYSVLIAHSASWIKSRPKQILVVVYLLLLLAPIATEATGIFSESRDEDSYRHLASFLSADSESGSILWVPSKPPLGFASPTHPSIDALTLLDERPFATGVVGSYDSLNFLRDAAYSGQLLSIASVRYLAIASLDPQRDSQKIEDTTYHELFSQQLINRPWVKSALKFGPVTLLETQKYQTLFFIPANTIFVVGSDDVYQNIEALADNGLVFVENEPQLLTRISQFPQASLLLNRKTNIDAAAALLPRAEFIFPSSFLDFSPNSSGWWKREKADFISWRDFLQQKYHLDNQDFDYGGGWAISEGQHELSIKRSQGCSSDCILLARVMTGPQSGKVIFSNIGEINTMGSGRPLITGTLAGKIYNYDRADFNWFEVGKISNFSDINVSSSGNINVVNAIAVVSRDSWEELKAKAAKIAATTPKAGSTAPQISYQKFDPTHYHISVKGLSGPATLAFGQNYDSFWRISGQSPVPLYSMINGFSIAGNGEYELIFLPQKYVIYGLIISAVTAVLVGIGVLVSKR